MKKLRKEAKKLETDFEWAINHTKDFSEKMRIWKHYEFLAYDFTKENPSMPEGWLANLYILTKSFTFDADYLKEVCSERIEVSLGDSLDTCADDAQQLGTMDLEIRDVDIEPYKLQLLYFSEGNVLGHFRDKSENHLVLSDVFRTHSEDIMDVLDDFLMEPSTSEQQKNLIKEYQSRYSEMKKDLKNKYPQLFSLNVQKQSQTSGGCYIATSIYGSYDCPEVWTLRRYRDYNLAEHWYGRCFIHIYYAVSPMLVRYFGDTVWFRKRWKKRLDRMVESLQKMGYESLPYYDEKEMRNFANKTRKN